LKDIRFKGHWIAGGVVTLLFTLLLAVRLDVFPNFARQPQGKTPGAASVSREEDQWMAIFQGQNRIGYAHRKLTASGRGYRFNEAVLMRINTMGVVQDIRLRTTGEMNPDMTLSAFRFDLQSSLFRFTAYGEVRDITDRRGRSGRSRSRSGIRRACPAISSIPCGGGHSPPGRRRPFMSLTPLPWPSAPCG